jgi:hypothetical protein
VSRDLTSSRHFRHVLQHGMGGCRQSLSGRKLGIGC